MAERASGHPITKDDLEAHLTKVNEKLKYVTRGRDIDSFFTLVKGIGSKSEEILAPETQQTLDVVIDGFSLFYEMNAKIEDASAKVDGGVTELEKKTFANSYSMFAAASYISNGISQLLQDQEPMQLDTNNIHFAFDLSKDDCLKEVTAKYYGIISMGKRNKFLKEGIDVPRSSLLLFKHLKAESLKLKESFNPKLVDLVKDEQFKVMDTFTISGFEADYEEVVKANKTEIKVIEPYMVAGNVLAKQEMLRDMDRIVLFDLITKCNPVLDLGGLSWSVLYDGLPGTGKDTLFAMGLTRLTRRCAQVSEFWKHKNLGELKWSKVDIDTGVKDEYYGKTGKNMLASLAPTKKPDMIYIAVANDIDMLVSGDRNSSSGGADKDIMKVLMDYLDSINSVVIGNTQIWAATNDATAMDPALRQRFIARYSVDGPQNKHDFADILYVKLGKWIDNGVIELGKSDYKPFESRKNGTASQATSGGAGLVGKITGVFKKGITMDDIGEFCEEQKKKNERFTGRAIHAVSEAIKKRINDYEIPEEWYVNPDLFFFKPYEERINILKGLCKKVTGEIIMEEIQRYAESELRYASDKFESDVKRTIHGVKVHEESMERLKKELGGAK